MKIPVDQLKTCDEVFDYALAKLNGGDGWACLSFVDTKTGRIANIYQDDSVETAMARALEEIRNVFEGVTGYTTAFDGGWYSKSGDKVRAIILDMERIDLAPVRLAYVIHPISSGSLDRLSDEIIGLPSANTALLSTNIEA